MSEPDDITSALRQTRGRTWDLVGIGACTWDTLMTVPDFVQGGGVARAGVVVRQGGGPVATALCQAARLGCRCAMIDHIGCGPVAARVADDLAAHGVDTRWLQAGEGEPARAMIQVREHDGERAIVFAPGSDREPRRPPDLDWHHVRVLHVNGRHEQLALQAIAEARAAGALVSFDGGTGRWRSQLLPWLEQTDLLVVAAGFAAAATGERHPARALTALRALAPAALLVGVTCGADGSWLATPAAEPLHVPAWRPSRVIDTTGAGDVYHGALLAGLLRGETLGGAARLAALRAGFNCACPGGRGALAYEPPAGDDG